jgi:hypothetical protein
LLPINVAGNERIYMDFLQYSNCRLLFGLICLFMLEIPGVRQERDGTILRQTLDLIVKLRRLDNESIISNSSACCHCQVSEGNADVSSIITVPAVTRQVNSK